VQQILHLFVGAFGLVTNIDKCITTPIHCTDDMVVTVQEVFPCVIALFSCKYLGISLSMKRLRRGSRSKRLWTLLLPESPPRSLVCLPTRAMFCSPR
jgi:hypothetical protein